MSVLARYDPIDGFSELRHQNLQPSSVDVSDLLETLSESFSEGIGICERNIYSDLTDTESDYHSRKAVPSKISFGVDSDAGPDDSESVLTAPASPTHPPFVFPASGEIFIPDFLHSHMHDPEMPRVNKSRLESLFKGVDHALKQLRAARQVLNSFTPFITPLDVNSVADGAVDRESYSDHPPSKIGQWPDLAAIDVQLKDGTIDTRPTHGACLTSRDRDVLSYGVHRHIGFTSQLLCYSRKYLTTLPTNSMVNLAMSPMLILEDFWIASGRIWSDGDRTLLTEALKLDPTGIDRPHPDNRRDDLGGVHRFLRTKCRKTRSAIEAEDLLLKKSQTVYNEIVKDLKEERLRYEVREAKYAPLTNPPPPRTHDEDDDVDWELDERINPDIYALEDARRAAIERITGGIVDPHEVDWETDYRVSGHLWEDSDADIRDDDEDDGDDWDDDMDDDEDNED